MSDGMPTIDTLVSRASNRLDAVDSVLAHLVEEGVVSLSDAAEIRVGLERRHALGSPTLGKGIAVPHLKHRSIDDYRVTLTLLTTPNNDWDAIDGEPVDLLIFVLAPMEPSRKPLPFFERLYRDLANGWGNRLRLCRTAEELAEAEAKRAEFRNETGDDW